MLNKKILKSFFCFLTFFLLVFNAQSAVLWVKSAMLMCYNSVIPSLFLFMIFSTYVSQSDIIFLLCLPFKLYSNIMKIYDEKYSAYLLLSLIGGFAVGSGYINELDNCGYCKNCIKSIAPSMINNSFSFCVFAVGIGFLSNYFLGLMLFISLSIASLATSFVLSFIYKYSSVLSNEKIDNKILSFVECVKISVNNILTICGFVIVFYCICEMILLYMHNKFIAGILCVFTEVTSGCVKSITVFGKNPYVLCICLSVLPISTLCQVQYFTQNFDIIKSLIISRFIHLPISLCVFSVLMHIFPVAANTANMQNIIVKSYRNTMEISATLFLITFAFITVFDQTKLFNKRK